MELEIVQLSTGSYIARPKGSLGTHGFYPLAWSTGIGKSEQSAIKNFYFKNPEWK